MQLIPLEYTVYYYANYPPGFLILTPVYEDDYLTGATVTKAYKYLPRTPPPDYQFAGWSLTPGGIAEYYPGESFIMPASDGRLYGVWTTKPVLNRKDHAAYMQGIRTERSARPGI